MDKNKVESHTLYLIPTPIGNLKDISIRALEVLEGVDLIYAEDTRHSLRLLNHYGIKKELISYHEHNEVKRTGEIKEKLETGYSIGLITDAGSPGISDPGHILVRELVGEKGIKITALPGATALVPALVTSGLDTDKFLFAGFLPTKAKQRREALADLPKGYTSIIYESPRRLVDLLEDINRVHGNIKISIAREISKLHEEIIRGRLEDVLKELEGKTIRGEIVVVLDKLAQEEEEVDIEEELKDLIEAGLSKSQAVKELAQKYKLSRNQLYKKSLDL